ncbi:MAG: alpha/beta hydrolase [Acidobacteriaceae bacterium]
MSKAALFRNPQLDGSSFIWEAGTTGVLLCHGFTATTAEVRLLAKVLHEHGYTVAGPLLPGHGTTPQDCNRHTWQEWYAEVEESYQRLSERCERVVAGGESTGALLVLHLACQHPEVCAILCYAPALKLRISRAKIFLLTLCMPFLSSIPKAPSKDENQWKGYTVQPLRGAYQLTRLQKTISPLLPEIRQPILIMQGKLDSTVDSRSPEIIYSQIGSKTKELHWLENSSHCVILDKERDLAAKLSLEFLDKVLL